MELLQLRYFQTIAQFESVTHAANHYHIPQSAMSQTLKRLERELGDIRLFDRRNNRIYLNENGRRFLESVNIALSALDDGVRSLKSQDETLSGPIHLLVMDNRRFITNCVSKFAERNPDVNFHICHDFYSGQDADYDLCISSNMSYKQMKASFPLVHERIVLAVHEQHPLAKRESISLSELQMEKFITQSIHSTLYNLTIERCRAFGFEPHISIICDDPYFVRKYVSQNMGVALAPSLSWSGRFRENTCLIPIVDPPIYTTSYLLWNDRRYQSPAVTAFRCFLKEEAVRIEGNLL